MIDKFVNWWLLRKWEFDNDALPIASRDRIFAEMAQTEGCEKMFRMRLQKQIKTLALQASNEKMIERGRGHIEELQAIIRITRKMREKFDVKETTFDEV